MNTRDTADRDRAMRRAEARIEWAKRARTDPVAFIEFVIKTERVNPKTGKQERLRLADMQVEMVEFCLKNRRGVIKASPKVGKSQIITIGLSLWIAGKDPSFRCAIGSLKDDFALFFTGAIKEHVESNEDLHLVFPHMRPAPGKWSIEKLYLDRGDARVVHPTWRALGANTGQQGTRVLVNVLDDIQDQESTETEARSDKTLRWIYAGESRMDKLSGDWSLADFAYGERRFDDERQPTTPVEVPPEPDDVDFGESADAIKTDISKRAGYRWLITNALRPYDAAHKLVAEDGWALLEAPVRDPKTGKTRLPAVYTQDDIDHYSQKNAPRDLDVKTRMAGMQFFREDWLYRAKQLGAGLRMVSKLDPLVRQQISAAGARLVCGVDLASRKNKSSDHTVFFLALVAHRPFFARLFVQERFSAMDSLLPPTAQYTMPLWIERRKMHSPEIRQCLYRLNDAFGGGVIFVVESNAAQDYIRQDVLVERRDIIIVPFYTGPLKNDPELGVEGGLGNDLEAGLVIVPSTPMPGSPETLVCEPAVEEWLQEHRDFVRGAHTGDSLMASWFVREFCFSRPVASHGSGILDTSPNHHQAPGAPGASPLHDQLRQLGVLQSKPNTSQAAIDEEVRRRFGF